MMNDLAVNLRNFVVEVPPLHFSFVISHQLTYCCCHHKPPCHLHQMGDHQIDVIFKGPNLLGEGPMWHAQEQLLYW